MYSATQTLRNLPLKRFKGRFFHGVADDNAVIQSNQRVRRSETEHGLLSRVFHIN
jgi:hypothetical protein